MFICCWSVKGGSGTTVVSVALALGLARSGRGGVLLVDMAGDVPATLGISEPEGPGLSDWFAAGENVPVDGLARIEIAVTPGLAVIPRGSGAMIPTERAEVLAAILAGESRTVVADLGRADQNAAAPLMAAAATQSLLVTRPCYLSLRRAVDAPVRPTGIVVVNDPGRALCAADVESVVGVAAVTEIGVDPAVARAVDAGLLASRMPRSLERAVGSMT